MSAGFVWIVMLVMTAVFFCGFVTIAFWSPLVAFLTGGLFVYALIQVARDAADL